MEALTLSDAAIACGVSRKALARRVERGTLQSVVDDAGRRRVPLAELKRCGLTPGQPRRGSGSDPVGARGPGAAPPTLAFVIERLEQLVAENAALRAIEVETGRLGLALEVERQARELAEAEVHRARARVLELQAQVEMPRRRRWWRRSVAAAAASPSS